MFIERCKKNRNTHMLYNFSYLLPHTLLKQVHKQVQKVNIINIELQLMCN